MYPVSDLNAAQSDRSPDKQSQDLYGRLCWGKKYDEWENLLKSHKNWGDAPVPSVQLFGKLVTAVRHIGSLDNYKKLFRILANESPWLAGNVMGAANNFASEAAYKYGMLRAHEDTYDQPTEGLEHIFWQAEQAGWENPWGYEISRAPIPGVDVKWIDQEFLPPLTSDAKCVLVKSAMGSGKSYQLRPLVAAAPKVAVIVPRRTLARNVAENLGISNYLDFADDLEALRGLSKFVISYDSVRKLTQEQLAGCLLIFDEAALGLDHLLRGDTNIKKYRQGTTKELIDAIRLAPQTLMLDADLSMIEVWWAQAAIGGLGKIELLVNSYKPSSKKFIPVGGEGELFERLRDSLEWGRKVAVAMDSVKGAVTFKEEMLKLLPNLEILLVTGDTNEDPEAVAFLAKPDEECTKWDAVIYTQTMCSGVDISGKYFDEVFLLSVGVRILRTSAPKSLKLRHPNQGNFGR
jgi:hypothetical protein